MADKASDSLPYGHFAGGLYSLDNSDWHFGRSTASHLHLQPLGPLEVIARGTAKASNAHQRSSGDGGLQSRRREKQSKALSKLYPELQPALHSLPVFVNASEAIEDAASQHDLVKGRLIATGKIYDESKRVCVPALVFPCGPTGSDLRIVEGLRQRQGWDEDRTDRIDSFSYSGRSGTWRGPGVTILSICFAQPREGGEHYLAVRLQTETLVLRPVLPKGASDLKPNVVFSVSIEDTGGPMHAHATFNPWFTGQLALVDNAGGWSVWESGRRRHAIKKIKEGSLCDKTSRKQDSLVNDGWAYADWVESASTVCIATRRKLVLVDLEAPAEDTTVIDLDLQGGLGWILDLGSTPLFNSNLFVVTSSHVVVLHIQRSSDGVLSSEAIWKVRHHRNPDDVSIRMEMCVNSSDVVLILRSAADSEVHQYFLRFSRPEVVMMQLPNALDFPRPAAVACLDFHVDSTPLSWNDEALASTQTPSLYHIYILGADLSVFRSLCKFSSGQEHTAVRGLPIWTTSASKTARQSKSSSTDVFAQAHDEAAVVCREPEAQFVRRRRATVLSRSDSDWTVSHSHLMDRLSEGQASEPTAIEEIIEEAASHLQGSQTAPATAKPMRTFFELADGSVDVKDVSGASTRLAGLSSLHTGRQKIRDEDELMPNDSQAAKLEMCMVAYPAAHNPGNRDGNRTLADSLALIHQHFLAPTFDALQSDTARRDALARQIAAEVTLAHWVLYPGDTTKDRTQETQSQSQVWELPVRAPAIEERSQDSKPGGYNGSSRATTPALPTPSASASTITGSSRPADFAAPETGRLGRYTSFSKTAPSALPRALKKVLGHWTVGTDPAEYDWQTTARNVSRRDEEADQDEMTEKERRQMQKRAERYMRRQRREAEESQRQQMLSSQAPEIVSASQPAQRPGARKAESQASAGAAVGSSQSYGFSQMAASQVVSGRHGGRPPAKKKRKSGF